MRNLDENLLCFWIILDVGHDRYVSHMHVINNRDKMLLNMASKNNCKLVTGV